MADRNSGKPGRPGAQLTQLLTLLTAAGRLAHAQFILQVLVTKWMFRSHCLGAMKHLLSLMKYTVWNKAEYFL